MGTNAYETTGSQVSIQQIKANSHYYYHHGAGIHIILCGYFCSYCKGPCPSPSPFFIRYGKCLDVDLHKLKINEFKLQKISSTLTFYSAWIFQSFLVLVILYYLTCHLYHIPSQLFSPPPFHYRLFICEWLLQSEPIQNKSRECHFCFLLFWNYLSTTWKSPKGPLMSSSKPALAATQLPSSVFQFCAPNSILDAPTDEHYLQLHRHSISCFTKMSLPGQCNYRIYPFFLPPSTNSKGQVLPL